MQLTEQAQEKIYNGLRTKVPMLKCVMCGSPEVELLPDSYQIGSGLQDSTGNESQSAISTVILRCDHCGYMHLFSRDVLSR